MISPWFPNCAFKLNACRYIKVLPVLAGSGLSGFSQAWSFSTKDDLEVGLCTLNQVDT
jgi:hypothetical protein